MKNLTQWLALLAVLLLSSACQHTYGVKISGGSTQALPVLQVRDSLDRFLSEIGFTRVGSSDLRATNYGVVAEWQRVYKKDFMYGAGFVYVKEHTKTEALVVSVSQTNGNPMRDLAEEIRTELQKKFPDYTVLLDSNMYLDWSWSK